MGEQMEAGHGKLEWDVLVRYTHIIKDVFQISNKGFHQIRCPIFGERRGRGATFPTLGPEDRPIG